MRKAPRTLPRRETRQDRRLKKIMAHLDLDTLVEPGVGMSRQDKKDTVYHICREIDRLRKRLEHIQEREGMPKKVPMKVMKAASHGD